MKIEKKKNQSSNIVIISTILVSIILVIFIFLLCGKTTTTGNFPENYIENSLNCSNNTIDYPFFSYNNTSKKNISINMIFADNKLKTIYLMSSLFYDNAIAIKESEANNHAAMNMSFSKDNLGPDALNVIYSKLDDRMQMSLYLDADEVNNTTLKYFLLEASKINNQTLDEYEKEYSSLGFICENN